MRPCLTGASAGIDRDRSLAPVRQSQTFNDGACGFRYTRFLANALWSRRRLQFAGHVSDTVCLRCLSAPETTQHLLWDCAANSEGRRKLSAVWFRSLAEHRSLIGPLFDFHMLPICLSSAGLVPNAFDCAPHQLTALQHYFCHVLRTCALARGTPEVF